MKISLKRDEIHWIYTSLFSLPVDLHIDKIFQFYVDINLKKLYNEFICVDSLKRSMVPSEEYKEFMEKRLVLERKYTSEVNGKRIIIEETRKEFEDAYKALMDLYSSDVIEHDSYGSEIGNILNEIVIVDIEPIPFKYFPKILPREFYQVLNVLRKESDEEILGKVQ